MRAPATATGALLIAALGVGLTSCAKTPPDSEEAPARARSAQDIRLYFRSRTPECGFAELGWVRGKRAYSSDPSSLKAAAFALGGDAVISVIGVYEMDSSGNERRIGYEGTAIRFTDPECTH
jgi:hypothetical protein